MRILVSLLFVVLLAVAACGSDSSTGSADSSNESESSSEDLSDLSQKPTPSIPDGPAPSEMVVEDILVGEGAEAVDGKTVKVQYVGVFYKDGEQFDASWDGPGSFEFMLGAGRVIKGWDEGVKGMKEGGRRQLILPPDVAYGDTGSRSIGPGETLVFVVDLLAVT